MVSLSSVIVTRPPISVLFYSPGEGGGKISGHNSNEYVSMILTSSHAIVVRARIASQLLVGTDKKSWRSPLPPTGKRGWNGRGFFFGFDLLDR